MARITTNISLTLLLATLFLHGCERHAASSEVVPGPPKAGMAANSVAINSKAVELSGIKSSLIISEPDNSQIKTTGEIKAAEPNVFHIS